MVALTYVTSSSERRKLIDRSVDGDWSVRDLARQIASRGADLDAIDPRASPDAESVRIALLEGLQSASRAALQVGIFVEAIQSRWVDGSGDLDLLGRAIDAHEKLQVRVLDALQCLRQASQSSAPRLSVRERSGEPVEPRPEASGLGDLQ